MTHEEICTYEVCKLAKEKGFPQDECGVNIGYYAFDGLRNIHPLVNSFAWYNDEYKHENLYLAPTQSLLQRWLRENGFGEVEVRHWGETDRYPHHYGWEVKDNLGDLMGYSSKMFDTYELALEAALKYTLKNLV